jgi:hypothetical protein
MKALVTLLIIAFAGLNIFQFVKNRDLTTDLELLKGSQQSQIDSAKSALAEENAKLNAKKKELEEKVANLEKEVTIEMAKVATATKPEDKDGDDGEDSSPMAAMSEMMNTPQMKEMIVAQQKATFDVMYKGLYEKLGLEGDELEHFKKLITDGQMAGIETGMSIMNPKLPEEERAALVADMMKNQEDLQAGIKEFLNDENDYKEYEFYSQTMGERMTVSGLQSQLQAKNIGLEPEQEDNLVRMMHEERTKVPFDNDFHDQNKFDPTALNNDTIDRFIEQNKIYEENLETRVGEVLTPEQTTVFLEQQKQAAAMQQMGLKMAAGMFGGKK